ncbi:MAG TPA: autotransporter-associated beta strand repeat-containing protein, partial [Thermoanaerobaculia bacterium]|nr:autotransporter-associated beta strand repeat-containing protein [Thermoanaerobaculia bacterium]
MKTFRAVTLLVLATLVSSGAEAATKTWTGMSSTTSPNWSDVNNWAPPGQPMAGDTIIFPTGATVLTSNVDYAVVLASITFQQGGFIVNVAAAVGGVGLLPSGAVLMTGASGNSGINGTLVAQADAVLGAPSGGTLTLGSVGTAGTLTKNGAGTLALNGASPMFTGNMAVTQGILKIQDGSALGPSGHGGTTISNGATLQVQGNIVVSGEALTLSGTGIGGLGALESLSGNNTWNGSVTLSATSAVGTDAGALTIGGVISGAAGSGLTKVGTGQLILPNANTYSGVTTVNDGIVTATNGNSLGTNASTVVNNGGTLQLDGTASSFTLAKSLTLSGSGAGGKGALWNFSGNNAVNGPTSVPTGTVTFVVDGVSTCTLAAGISGAGGLTKIGPGTLTLSGATANTYAGTTFVNQGILNLNHSPSQAAVPGALVIGTGAVGGPAIAQVVLSANNQIADAGTITIDIDGLLDVGNRAETIGPLTMLGGGVSLGTGILTLSGNVSKPSGATTATIGGNSGIVNLIATRIVDTGGTGSPDIQVNAIVQGPGGLVKNGTGTLQLANNNTYTGTLILNAGVVSLQNPNALGSNTAASGTTVNTGGALVLNFSPFALGEFLTLNGSGNAAAPAALVASFTTALTGGISLQSNATIAEAGSGQTLTVSGIVSGTGGLTTAGAAISKIILSGDNTYAGGTTISSGTLEVQHDNAMGTPLPGVIVDPGATLSLNGNLQIAQLTSLAGSGVLGAGTLHSTNGTSAISGATVFSDSTVTVAVDAQQLTLSGPASGMGGGLTKIGGGTLILSGANTYTGTTTVNAGTLLVNGTQSASAVALTAGTLGGSGTT